MNTKFARELFINQITYNQVNILTSLPLFLNKTSLYRTKFNFFFVRALILNFYKSFNLEYSSELRASFQNDESER